MLFTDIEGSTALLSRMGDLYGDALSEQRRIMRAAISASSGREMGTEGDSFFVVFESAQQALGACIAAQRELIATEWPAGAALHVRMGVHTGEPSRHEDGYVGMDVNYAARIAATAHGGQVVMSSVTAQLFGAGLPSGVRLVDLGWHRLKDIDEPARIFQLAAPDLPVAFPPLKSLGRRTSLPVPATPLVGRDTELGDLNGILSRPTARLVTLTGPGGVGKTRVALALAASVDTDYQDGVFFVPLATVTDTEVMWKVIADAVGAKASTATGSAVSRHLAERSVLLVLDNLEQIADAPAVVAHLLAAARHATVVATSRRPLHLQGELEYSLPPLASPNGSTLEQVAASDAVTLFVQQAALVRRGFALTHANADDVAAICRRLDGLPLAIELAAARAKLLPPRALLSRLGESLDLVATDVNRPSRQQTMRATIAWSHDLLTSDVAMLFRRLGVFADGCDLDALTAVTLGPDAASDSGAALKAINDLVDVSLVTASETDEGDLRIGMLQTVREYARDQLALAGETESTNQRHAEYYANFAERVNAEVRGPTKRAWLDRVEVEHNNLRAALSWTLGGADNGNPVNDQQRSALGLRIVSALSWFWILHYAHAAEGRRWLELAIKQTPVEETGPALAGALRGLGWLFVMSGETERAKATLERHVILYRQLGDATELSYGLELLGVVHRQLGQLDLANRRIRESREIDKRNQFESRGVTDLVHLANIAMDRGDPDGAVTILNDAVGLAVRLEDTLWTSWTRAALAAALTRSGRPRDAIDLLCTLVDDVTSLGIQEMFADTLDNFAEAAAALGADLRAACLSGAANSHRERIGLPRPPPDDRHLELSLAPARQRVGRHAWEAEIAAGRKLTPAEALRLASQLSDSKIP